MPILLSDAEPGLSLDRSGENLVSANNCSTALGLYYIPLCFLSNIWQGYWHLDLILLLWMLSGRTYMEDLATHSKFSVRLAVWTHLPWLEGKEMSGLEPALNLTVSLVMLWVIRKPWRLKNGVTWTTSSLQALFEKNSFILRKNMKTTAISYSWWSMRSRGQNSIHLCPIPTFQIGRVSRGEMSD